MELRRASTVLGCGCAAVIALFLVAVLTLTWGTYRAGNDFERVARDPEAATERAREVVEFGELPEGYPALGALSVPLLLDVAFFMEPPDEGRDRAAGEPTPPPDRGFLYVKLRDWLGRGDELREALGGSSDGAPLDQQGLAFDPDEVVGRGHLVVGEAQVQWLARRGTVRIDPAALGGGDDRGAGDAGPADGGPAAREPAGGEPAAGEPGASEAIESETGGREPAAAERPGRAGRAERRVARAAEDAAVAAAGDAMPGILSILAFDCPGEDSWHRLGVWFAPDPAPELPASEVDWSGTPGDPAAIGDFLGRFEICG